MRNRNLKEKITSGQRVYGTLVTVTDPDWLKPIVNLNLDFAFIDMEHISHNLRDVSYLCRLFTESGIDPVVRISKPDPYEASVALDAGAVGVIAPYIESTEEVRKLVGAVKFKPLKGERLRQFLAGEITLEKKLRTYIEKRNSHHLFFANIESIPAVDNLAEILSVDGLDGVIIGPHDLSCSLGIPEEYEHPMFLETIDKIIDTARKYNKAVGYHKGYSNGDCSPMIAWAKKGLNVLIHEADILAAIKMLTSDLNNMRTALGDVVQSRTGVDSPDRGEDYNNI